jgi:hypothetical protein
MLLRADTLAGIAAGTIRLAFRRRRRPTVRTGGTLLTSAGQVQIGSVEPVEASTLSSSDAALAGYASVEALLAELDRRPDGTIYRIELLGLQPDPRVALREAPVSADDIADLRKRLRRLDAASPVGAWTHSTLVAIRHNPGLRAGDLCRAVGQERLPFKANVRKLKRLGLTISLETGYRLSPRGEAYLTAVESEGTAGAAVAG